MRLCLITLELKYRYLIMPWNPVEHIGGFFYLSEFLALLCWNTYGWTDTLYKDKKMRIGVALTKIKEEETLTMKIS